MKPIMKNETQFTTAVTPVRKKLGFTMEEPNPTNKSPQQRCGSMTRIGRQTLKARDALVITIVALLVTGTWVGASGTWSPTGSMAIGRFSFSATALQKG